ncbi:MAG: Zn-ribbon domain-containing OB-fold protein [Thermoplasmatales archaeon]|nr:Zn-ribbon domain-containing OB-fold protein [Thermoplasmatales archaeon]
MTFVEKQTDPTTPMHWNGDMQADYLYPSGVAGDKLFKHIMKNDSFLASKCPKCNKTYFPPRMYCEDCFCEIPEKEWKEVPTTGTIKLHTIVTIDTYGQKLEEPKVIGMINIDNTDGVILGVIKTENIDEDMQGMQVKAVFQSQEKREGTLKDILHFTKK